MLDRRDGPGKVSSGVFFGFPECYPVRLTPLTALRLTLLLSVASLAAAQPSALLDAMSQELNRNFTVLKQKADPPPYFLSYEVTEQDYRGISGTLGTISSTGGGKDRVMDVSVRVGAPKLDNYHNVRG